MNQKLREIVETFMESHPGIDMDKDQRYIEAFIEELRKHMLECAVLASRAMNDVLNN